MTGINQNNDYEDKITYRTTQSVRDTISNYSHQQRRTKTPKCSDSIFSNRRYDRDLITGRADPNTIDVKDRERRPRQLNDLVEGKYSKRMQIQGKDMYKDLDVLRNHQQHLVDQARNRREIFSQDKLQSKEDELEIISQIKESLNDATRKKQNVLYKQKLALSSQLNEQVKDKQ